MRSHLWIAALLAALSGWMPARSTAAPPAPSPLDRLLNEENAERKLTPAPLVDDLSFLRRATVDLIGRIPTEEEIQRYLALPAGERRSKTVDVLMKDPRFTDRWTIFFADMLRLRANAPGGAQAYAFVYTALRNGMPYDEMVRTLLSATGRPGHIPEAGFILSDEADPMALAGATSQVFMGIRVACAQCHNHPFDVWTREQFYGLAAFFGNVRKGETKINKIQYTMEVNQTSILWPPEEKARGRERKPVKPTFPFDMDQEDGAHVARFQKLRADQLARANEARKPVSAVDDLLDNADGKLDKRTSNNPEDRAIEEARRAAAEVKARGDRARGVSLRDELGKFVTSPRNRDSRAIANRIWADLVGRGFVEPVDDFRQDNPISHPKTLDYLADEFVANGFDFRVLVKLIVMSEAYQRGHLPGDASATTRLETEKAFLATPVRRMLSEVLYDSLVQAGHLFEPKYRAGENTKVVKVTVREAVPIEDDKNVKKPKAKTSVESMKRERVEAALKAQAMPTGGYDLESALELAVDPAKFGKGEPALEMMRKASVEEIEAERMAMEKADQRVRYVEKVVEQKYDDNPKFIGAMRMQSPAPPAHFLRIFGQPARDGLGDHRDHSASMRQGLLMLNGKLTHEASRVGTLEPMCKLMKDKDFDGAIKLAYREILTREPSEAEIKDAKAVLSEAATPLDGMADLRWVLLNCHEFRFLP